MSGPVGLVGLGLLGRAIAARLRAAGVRVIGYDIEPQAMRDFGGATAATLEELGCQAERVVLAVFDTADVERVAAQIRPKVFIDCTTGDPLRIEALAVQLEARGVRYIEATLSGSSDAVARGVATMYVGGDPSGCEGLLEAIAATRVRVGPAGAASRAKLATNLVLGLNRAALAEGMAFAEALGIGRQTFLDLVRASPAASPAALAKGEKMVAGDYSPESRIRQHLKDVERMLEYGRRAQLALPLSAVHAGLLAEAVSAGDGELDNAAIVRRWTRGAA